MSLDVTIDIEGAAGALGRLAAADLRTLLEGIGAEVESQTRARIATAKRAPSGTPWAPWTPQHAKTRRGGQSLLRGRGDLLDSITNRVTADSVLVGTNLRYAAIHQFGGLPGMAPGPAGVPARPYLGVSDEDRADIAALASDFLAATFAGAA